MASTIDEAFLSQIDEIEVRVAHGEKRFEDGTAIMNLAAEVSRKMLDALTNDGQVEAIDLAVLVTLKNLCDRYEAIDGQTPDPTEDVKRILRFAVYRVIPRG